MADDSDDDLTFWVLAIAAAGAVFYFVRGASAATVPTFEGTAPGTGTAMASDVLGMFVPMQVSGNGAAFIAQAEGFLTEPNAAGEIGYGHTIRAGEQFNTPMSQRDAVALLLDDLNAPNGTAAFLNSVITVPVSQNQFDALASLAYNIGNGAFAGSTLLADLNAGDYASAAQQFDAWNQSHGQIVAGLVNRRSQEQQLFNF